ncbi:TonB-dependent receptor [Fulvivirga sp. 29W222]|uniref:TonB-dependent receptor n=1 Tax=Fulvivirga marina TaxID=2494733 RepID=A0A937FYG5_9BACT|nr:TonB-dependent receptor [Fulvivirga marina]MBL6447102.1 TonB-dependent receptor [Fulvivirga marina]
MRSFLLLLLFSLCTKVMAQELDPYETTMEELMQIEIYSVSKKTESLFDAPLSSSTLTSDEIINSGATSIPEALRLIPGLIVREQANGTYDVHLRGFDNLTRYSRGADAANHITLIMIDDRPVFNNNQGGVYWETIPINLIDIDRIEVIRGPSAPLYGPNAVAGVINIITKKIEKDGLTVNADVRAGTHRTQIGGIGAGYKFNDKISAYVSGNYEIRDRYDDLYFEYTSDSYKPVSELISFDGLQQPVPEAFLSDYKRSIDKHGVNLFLNYNPVDDMNIRFQSGMQKSQVQKVYITNDWAPLSSSEYETKYLNLSTTKGNLKGRVSYVNGKDHFSKGMSFPLLKYKYETLDASVEYNWILNDDLSIRPGAFYQSATYSDKDYVLPQSGVVGVLNAKQTMTNSALSMSVDYNLTESLRLIGGTRLDKFSSPDDIYVAYQLSGTYHMNENNVVRAVYSKSNSGSFIGPNYANIYGEVSIPNVPEAKALISYSGNKDMKLFQIRMMELGFRSKIMRNLEFDVELFRQTGKDIYFMLQGKAPEPYIAEASQYFYFQNIDAEAIQNGITLSANYVPNNKLQVKPFITWQKTEVEDMPAGFNTEAVDPVNNINNTATVSNDQTPSLFGGIYVNYKFKQLNVNLNPYYMSRQHQYSFYSLMNPATTSGEIDSKFILNAKISYDITKNINLYINARNALNDQSREFMGADENGALLLGGLRVAF